MYVSMHGRGEGATGFSSRPFRMTVSLMIYIALIFYGGTQS